MSGCRRRGRVAARLLLAVLALIAPVLAIAQVHASLDRQRAQLGDTVTLTLQSQAGPVAAPDLSALENDFQVLGRSSGSTISYVNGQRSVQYAFGVALRPLHEGRLSIPPLHVGGDTTEPLELTVTAPSSAGAGGAQGPVFVEASVAPGQAYVGQQVALTVKLYYTANLANATLADPRVDGADVSRIGGDIDYQAERDGRIYNVIERHYVVVPQRPGELAIPPIAFQGELLDPNDPDSFLGMGAPVFARTRPLTVTVAAVPSGWGQAAWLPARQLALTLSGVPDAAHPARVGQPFNLVLALEATGLSYEALPALSLPTLQGATAYPDKPVTGNRADGPWVVGRRQQDFAVVPGRAGTLHVPAITLRWWNVQTDQAETATLPARDIPVLPAAGAAPAAGAGAGSAPAASSLPPAPPTSADASDAARAGVGAAPGHAIGWALLALAGVALLAVGRVAVMRRRRRAQAAAAAAPVAAGSAPASTAAAPRQAFLAAAAGGDVAVQARCLLAWARAERPGLRHLGELAAALEAQPQRAAIAALQRARFAGAEAPDGEALSAAFAGGFAWRSDERSGAGGGDEPLPPLYPFKLR